MKGAILEVIAGVFNDQIFGYRDIQLFHDFAARLKSKQEYDILIKLFEKDHKETARLLKAEDTPGYIELSKNIKDIEHRHPEIRHYEWSKKLEEAADEMLNPFNLITAISVCEQKDSYYSGTGFTARLTTGLDGSTWAKFFGEFPTDPDGDFEGFTRFMTINCGTGLGPGIVNAAFVPDKLEFSLPKKGGEWVYCGGGYEPGPNDIAMVFLEKAFKLLEGAKYSEKKVTQIVELYKEWGELQELKALRRAEYGKEGLTKETRTRKEILEARIIIKQKISKEKIEGWIKTRSRKLRQDLSTELGIEKDLFKHWVTAMQDLWYNLRDPEKRECPPDKKAEVLKSLKLNEDQFFTLSYLIKHMNGIDTPDTEVTYIPVPKNINSKRLLPPKAVKLLNELFAEVGNIEGKAHAQDKGEFDRRVDIEFAISRCNADSKNRYKFQMEAYDQLTGESIGEQWFEITHVQNRPINPPRESSTPFDLIFKKLTVDQKFIEKHNITSIGKTSLKTVGAGEGEIYIGDPKRSWAAQEQEIREMGRKGKRVIVVLQQMGAEHDNIVRTACMYGGGAIVWQGNETSHPFIFATEQRFALIVNPKIDPRYKKYFKKGARVTIDAENGVIYPGDKKIPLVLTEDVIRKDLIPKVTKAGIIASTAQSAEEIARLGLKSVLSRIEFFVNDTIRIYPQGAEAYDNLMKVCKSKGIDITTEELNALRELKELLISKTKAEGSRKDEIDEYAIVELIKNARRNDIDISSGIAETQRKLERLGTIIKHEGKETYGLTEDDIKDIAFQLMYPGEILEIRNTIKGFSSAGEFITEKMRNISNLLGMLFPRGNNIRDYDNKEKEALLYNLVSAGLYLRYDDRDNRYNSPLVGLRGSALMSHPHLKKGFLNLRRGILRSIKDGFSNNHFFFVFNRTPEELKIQVDDFAKLCKEEGVYPEELGVMIETPVNVWTIAELIKILVEFKKAHPEVKKVFISFGTNDWTKTTGGVSRECKDFTAEVEIRHPVLVDVDPESGKIQMEERDMAYGPKEPGKPWILKIDDEAAPVILRMAEHVVSYAKEAGIDSSLCGSLVVNAANMGRLDIVSQFIGMLDSIGSPTAGHVPLTMRGYDVEGSVRTLEKKAKVTEIATLSEVKVVGVVTEEVVHIDKPEDLEKIRQKGKSVNKIVIIKCALGSKEELKKEGLKWDYLRYAASILIDESVEEETQLFKDDKEIGGRVRGKIKTTTTEEINDMDIISIDYNNKKVYKGKVPVDITVKPLKRIALPDREPEPNKKDAVLEKTADVIKEIGIHPLAFVGYLHDLGLTKKESKAQLKAQLSEALGREVTDKALTRIKKEFIKESKAVPEEVKEKIKSLLMEEGQKRYGDENAYLKNPMKYLEDKFYDAMVESAKANPGKPVIHSIFDLTRNELRELEGGEEIERTKGREGENFDDPLYRLFGGARGISDFWYIFQTELNAYKRAKQELPDNNLKLQLTTIGVRGREILEAQLRVLKAAGINPKDEEIGLKIRTQADVLYVEGYEDSQGHHINGYIDQGIKFFSYDRTTLVSLILAANMHHPDIFKGLPKEFVAERALKDPLRYVHYAIEKAEKKGVWLAVTEEGENLFFNGVRIDDLTLQRKMEEGKRLSASILSAM
jgi:phosphohistidine swiveling domain-containing protein